MSPPFWKINTVRYGYVPKNAQAFVLPTIDGTISPWQTAEVLLKDENNTVYNNFTCFNNPPYFGFYIPVVCSGYLNTSIFEDGDRLEISVLMTDMAGNMATNDTTVIVDTTPPTISAPLEINSTHFILLLEVSDNGFIDSWPFRNYIDIYKIDNETSTLASRTHLLTTNFTSLPVQNFDANVSLDVKEYHLRQNDTVSEIATVYSSSFYSETLRVNGFLDSGDGVYLYFNRTDGTLFDTTYSPQNISEILNISINNITFHLHYPLNESYNINPILISSDMSGEDWYFSITVEDIVGNIANYSSQNASEESSEASGRTQPSLSGYVKDYYRRPLGNLTIVLSNDNITTYSITTENGEYQFENLTYPANYTIRIPLNESFIDVRDFRTSETFVYEITISMETPELEYNIILNSTAISEASVVYYYLKEVTDFFTKTLNFVFDHEMPEKVYIFGNRSTFHTRSPDMIEIDERDSAVNSTNAPDNREWHEFSHHAMFDAYEMMPPQCGGTYNHRGWENPSTSDSWCEGFAEFIPLVISDYNNESQPWIYGIEGGIDMEDDRQAGDGWPLYRASEELAVASLLWDLYDSNETYAPYPERYDDDNVSINATDMWNVMSSKHNLTVHHNGDPEERYIYYVHDLYDMFISSGLANQTDIENLFAAHGFPNGQADVPFTSGRH